MPIDNADSYIAKDNAKNLDMKDYIANIDDADKDFDVLEKLETELNELVEKHFDMYMQWYKRQLQSAIDQWNTNRIQTIHDNWLLYMQNPANPTYKATENILQKIENQEIKLLMDNIRLDLRNMENYVQASTELQQLLHETNSSQEPVKNTKSTNTTVVDYRSWWSSTEKKNSTKEKSDMPGEVSVDILKDNPTWLADISRTEYKDTQVSWYNADVYNIENIYSDRKLYRTLERIFDNEPEDLKELRNKTFKINLSKEDGLAYVIDTIKEEFVDAYKTNPNWSIEINHVNYKLSEYIIADKNDNAVALQWFSRRDIKNICPDYDPGKWRDNEKRKIRKILNNAQRKDLYTFSALLEARSDISTTIKSWNNALESTGNSRADKNANTKNSLQFEWIDTREQSNILQYLCDWNSDGTISTASKKKENKKQKNQWDVGNLFGNQVFFTLEQAIKSTDALLADNFNGEMPYKWENIVIQNIIQAISIDERRQRPTLDQKLADISSDPKNSTIEKLWELLTDHPEFKLLFRSAIEKINGWADALSPDLYDTLTGHDGIDLINTISEERELKNAIDEALENNDELKLLIQKQWLVHVRQTLFTNIMDIVDNMEFYTSSDSKDTNIRDNGLEKWFEIQKTKKWLLQQTVHNLLTIWLRGWVENIRIPLWFKQYGTSESGKTKRWVNINAGPKVRLENGEISLVAWLGLERAQQLNYKRVVTSPLDTKKIAQYLGLEWKAAAQAWTTGIWLEVWWWVQRLRDPETAINQIDKTYREISDRIFDVRNIDSPITVDRIQQQFLTNQSTLQYHGNGIYREFIQNNRKHLESNRTFILNFIQANNLLEDINNADDPAQALNNLTDILQSWSIEQRRHDLISHLHGKLSLTKLSFGVTSSMLGWNRSNNDITDYGQSGHGDNGGNVWPDVGSVDSWTNRELGSERLSVAGVYVSARISTWKNHYVPQEKQRLMAQEEIHQWLWREVEFGSWNLDHYADYLEWLYNDPSIFVEANNNGTLSITGNNLLKKLWVFVIDNDPKTDNNKRDEVLKNCEMTNSKITIWNIGEIGAYTVAEWTGVRKILVLGKKWTEWTTQQTVEYRNEDSNKIESILEWSTDTPRSFLGHELKKNISAISAENLPVEARDHLLSLIDENGLQLDQDEVTAITNGKISVYKTIINGQDSYDVRYEEWESDKLTIYYHEVTWTKDVEKYKNQNFHFEYAHDTQLRAARDLLSDSDMRQSLHNLEHKAKLAYINFLSTLSTVWSDGTIQLNNIWQWTEYILEILEADKNNPDIIKLKEFINNTADNYELWYDRWYTLAHICNEMKTIFAMEITWYKNKTPDQLFAQRREKFKTLTGPEWSNLGANLITEISKARNKLRWSTSTFDTISQNNETISNIIGYTAFYRYNKWDHQKFSLTPPGATNVFGGKDMIHTIPNGDKKEATERFVNNIEKNTVERSFVQRNIMGHLANLSENNPELKKALADPTLFSKEKTTELLRNWQTSIMLDKWPIIITMSHEMVTYLLWECANESCGMQINDVSISYTEVENEVKELITEIDQPYDVELSTRLTGKAHSVSEQVKTEEMRAWITAHKTIPQRGIGKPDDYGETGHGDTDTWTDSWDNTGWGDTWNDPNGEDIWGIGDWW